MPPDEALARAAAADELPVGAILDADLVQIDSALRAAGRHADLSLRGRTQPTRWFAITLRDHLAGRLLEAADTEAGPATPR